MSPSSSSQLVISHLLRFLWINAAPDRLGAWWKPQIPVLHWIWSLLRYRLILHLPNCREMIAPRWVVYTWWGEKTVCTMCYCGGIYPWVWRPTWKCCTAECMPELLVWKHKADLQNSLSLSDAGLFSWRKQGSGYVFSNSHGYGIAMTTEAGQLHFFLGFASCCSSRAGQTEYLHEVGLTVSWNKACLHYIFQPRSTQCATCPLWYALNSIKKSKSVPVTTSSSGYSLCITT